MNIIPAIDLIEGRCVRLMQGRYSQCSTYEKSPLDMARAFEDAGLRSLHLVDLDGARAGSLHNLSTLESIASQTDLQIDFSGGIRSRAAISQAFDAGADLLCVGSAAVLNPEEVCLWLEE